MTPSISVVIPVYNRFDRLKHSVESVLAQTLPVSEVILVDDGSFDGTSDLLPVYIAQNPTWRERVRYFRQENQGPNVAHSSDSRRNRRESSHHHGPITHATTRFVVRTWHVPAPVDWSLPVDRTSGCSWTMRFESWPLSATCREMPDTRLKSDELGGWSESFSASRCLLRRTSRQRASTT